MMPICKIRTLCLSIFMLIVTFIASNNSFATMGNGVKFDHLQLENKYSKDPVISITQDKIGFLWFLTPHALIRYDGENYKSFSFITPTIKNPMVLSCSQLDDTTFWIGTSGFGLIKFDITSEKYDTFKTGTEQSEYDKINSIKLINKTEILIGTDIGLKKFDKLTQTFIIDDKLLNNANVIKKMILAVQTDLDGNIWLASNESLLQYNISSNQYVLFENNAPKLVKTITSGMSGDMWFGSSEGLYKFDKNTKQFSLYKYDINKPNSLSCNDVSFIYEGNDTQIFIGTLGGGVSVLDTKNSTFEDFQFDSNNPFSIGSNEVYSVFKDLSDNYWFGTTGEISKINKQKNKFAHYKKIFTNPNTLIDNRTTAIFEDSIGNLWIGTKNGLDKLEKSSGKYIHYLADEKDTGSISNNFILSITEDKSGNIWVGTKGGGLNKFITKTGIFKHYINNANDNNSLTDDNVTALLSDNKGAIWIGTLFGLNRYNEKTDNFVRYTEKGSKPTSLTSYKIKALCNDQSGDIWIGTDSGLNRFDQAKEIFIQYKNDPANKNSLSSDVIEYIYQNTKGTLWIATSLGGLVKFDTTKNEFKTFTTKDGLPDNNIYGVLRHENDLWLSSRSGISKMNVATNEVINYDLSYGLQKNEFNSGVCFMSKDEQMFFGGDNGFNSFYPKKIAQSEFDTRIAVTSMKKFAESITDLKNINLSYKDTSISFEFASFDFTFPEKNKFMYMLEGLDKDWINAETRKFASYSNLSGGTYTFKVKGTNSSGVWSDNIQQVTFFIKTAPWKTWWAYSLYVIFFVLSVYSFIRIRTKLQEKEINRQKIIVENLKKIDKMKDELLANTSHELRTPLNGIIGITQGMLDGARDILSEKTAYNLTLILKSSKRILSLVNDILDFAKLKKKELILKLEAVNISKSLEDIIPVIQTLYIKKQIEIISDISIDIADVRADRYRLEQVFYNILGNAVKYTNSGSVKISAQVNEGMVEISFADTGIGIPNDKLTEIFQEFIQLDASTSRETGGTGLGLSVTKELLEAMSGKIWVTSKLGVGSTFTISLPLSKEKALAVDNSSLDYQSYSQISDTHIEMSSKKETGLERKASAMLNVDKAVSKDEKSNFLEKIMDYENNTYKILVVDDEIINLHVLSNYIEAKKNFQIYTAESGAEALEMINNGESFDIVILDVMMPKMSGYEVCQSIRKKYSLFELPVVMLTAKNQAKDIVEGFEAGANDYLVKPFDFNELHARIKTPIILKHAIKNLIINTLRFETEQKQRLMSETLKEISETLTSTLKLEEVLRRLMDSIQKMVYYDTACIILHDGTDFILKAYKGSLDTTKYIQHINDIKNKKLFNNFFKDIDIKNTITDNYFSPEISDYSNNTVSSWLDVPINFHGNVLGVISLQSYVSNLYSHNEEIMLRALANQAGIALENARLYSKVIQLASTDSMTGILNRKSFFEEATVIYDDMHNSKNTFSLLMVDIDKFKNINDSYGHLIGDKVIINVSACIKNHIQDNGITGRFGGEEFIGLLKFDCNEALTIAEKIRKSIETIVFWTDDKTEFRVTVSIGISAYDGISNLNSLVKLADKALYEAKNGGRNQCVVSKTTSINHT